MISKIRRFFSDLFSLKNPVPSGANLFETTELSSPDLQTLLILSQTMTFLRDLDEVLGFLLGEVQKRFQFNCGVLMVDEDKYFRVRCHRGFSRAFVSEFKALLGEGPISDCFSLYKKTVFKKSELAGIPSLSPLIQSENWNTVFLAPVLIQNQTLGVFLAGAQEENFFQKKMVAALDPFIQILAVGMRNAQLAERIEKFNRRLEAEVLSTTEELTRTNSRLIHRVQELKTLYEIASTIGQHLSLEVIFKEVISRVQGLFNMEQVGFFLNFSTKDHFIDLVSQVPSFGLPREAQERLRINSSQLPEKGVASNMILDAYTSGETKVYRGEPISLKELCTAKFGSSDAELLKKIAIRSALFIPLKTSQKTLGVMALMNPSQELPFSSSAASVASEDFKEGDIQTLLLIAGRVAAAIENLQLDLEIKKRLADLSTLQEISETFYAHPVIEFDLAKIAKTILKTTSCDFCTFMFFDPDASVLDSRSSGSSTQGEVDPSSRISTKDEKDIAVQVFKQGKSRILDDSQMEQFASNLPGIERDLRSMMFVPLKIENRVIGILKLGKREKSFFNQHHLRLSELVADRVAAIVENARLYEKLLQTNKELERLNRVKTEFVSMVSHELRTPVTAIKGFVDLMITEEAGPINDQQKRFLKITASSIERLTLLISDLLDLSRIESGQMKMEMSPVHIEELLRESAETYRSTIESKKISFSLEINKQLPQVLADGARIKQVIDNLLSNAMKFTPTGGQIRMIADDLGDFVLVSVSDTGVGIKKEDQEKIFEKFYQVDSSLTRQTGGTGLGLAISKSIVDMHSGRIWVESDLGKGSTFRCLLPRLRPGQLNNVQTKSVKNEKKEKPALPPHSLSIKAQESKHSRPLGQKKK